jgi:hypothetical protein
VHVFEAPETLSDHAIVTIHTLLAGGLVSTLAEAAEASQTLPQVIIERAKNYAKDANHDVLIGKILDMKVSLLPLTRILLYSFWYRRIATIVECVQNRVSICA